MTFVTTLDITGLTLEEYRAVLTRWASKRGRHRHLSSSDYSDGFRLSNCRNMGHQGRVRGIPRKPIGPASEALGIERKIVISITPLHNFFAPRLDELPGLVSSLPGADFGCDEVTAWRFTGCLAGFGPRGGRAGSDTDCTARWPMPSLP